MKPDEPDLARKYLVSGRMRPLDIPAGEIDDSPKASLSAARSRRWRRSDTESEVTPKELDDGPRAVLGRPRSRVSWRERLLWLYAGAFVFVLALAGYVVIFDANAREAVLLALITAVVAPLCAVTVRFAFQSRRGSR